MSGPKTTTTQRSTGKTNSSSSTKSQLSPYKPAAQEVAQIPDYASTAYGQAQPYLAPGMTELNNFQQGLFNGGGFGQGIDNLETMSGALDSGGGYLDQGSGLLGKASGYLDPIASGSLVGQDNPYLQSILANITDQVNNQIGSQFAAAGRPLGTNNYGTRSLAKGLAEGLANPLFQNYQFERGQQLAGITGLQNIAAGYGGLSNDRANLASQYGSIPGLYDASAANKNQAGLQGAGIQTLMQTLPYTSAQNYSNLLMPSATAFGKNKSKSKSKGTTINVGTGTSSVNDGGASTAGMIIGGLGLLSDRRAKEDIEPVGKLYDGQTVYRFKYKGDDVTQIGLMADEVEKVRPEAVYTGRNGLKLVDYKLATDGAAI